MQDASEERKQVKQQPAGAVIVILDRVIANRGYNKKASQKGITKRHQ